jgi:hypothetical protein
MLDFILYAVGLFAGMIGFFELGRRFALRHRSRGAQAEVRTGPVEGAVFALFGLLLAFTFSGAASRFDQHRDLALKEANAISNAYRRVDLLPAAKQPEIRAVFRKYAESRISAYRTIDDEADAAHEHERGLELEKALWRLSADAALETNNTAIQNLALSSLSGMFEIGTARLTATRIHPPAVIYALLFGLGLMTSLLAGYAMASDRRPWLHVLVFTVVVTMTVYVILDIEYPRLGFVRVDAADQLLANVLKAMQ